MARFRFYPIIAIGFGLTGCTRFGCGAYGALKRTLKNCCWLSLYEGMTSYYYYSFCHKFCRPKPCVLTRVLFCATHPCPFCPYNARQLRCVVQLLVQMGQVSQRALHKQEKEAREAGKASFFLAWVSLGPHVRVTASYLHLRSRMCHWWCDTGTGMRSR